MTPTPASRPPDASPGRYPPTRRRRTLVVGSSLTLAAALVAGGTVAIRAGAEASPRPPAAAVPSVATVLLERSDAHEIRRTYAARVEPAREGQLSFEAGGTLAEVAVEEGDRVAAGAVLARLDTRMLRAKRDQLAAARGALDSDAELAALALERQRQLGARGFAADEALDEARLGAARITSRIAEADAGLSLVDVELDKAVLRAPFDALVGERRLDPGATVPAGASVLSLLEAGTPRLRVGLPPERAATLDRDRAYRFDAGEREIPARLVALRSDVDPRTRTVSALFEPVDAAGDALFFGELLELVLTERVPGAVFDVPIAALVEDEQGLWSVLSVIEPSAGSGDARNGQARLQRVAVRIVHLTGERAWVAAALDDAPRIVADGTHRVIDGERVRVATPGADLDTPGINDDTAARRIPAGERGA